MTAADPVARIASALRIDEQLVRPLGTYQPADAAVLADAVEHAVTSQAAELNAALESALQVVPRPLRGRARRMLFPGGRHG